MVAAPAFWPLRFLAVLTSPAHCPGDPRLWPAQPGHADAFAAREPACPPTGSPCHSMFYIKQPILFKMQ